MLVADAAADGPDDGAQEMLELIRALEPEITAAYERAQRREREEQQRQ